MHTHAAKERIESKNTAALLSERCGHLISQADSREVLGQLPPLCKTPGGIKELPKHTMTSHTRIRIKVPTGRGDWTIWRTPA